jgi:regulator of protease activity HflC (stomatin/prohibitin superfamily)
MHIKEEDPMDQTRTRIRHLFLSPRPHFPLNTVAELLEMSVEELKAEIKDGGIVAVSTAVGVRVTREEMVAAAIGRWELAVIERALGLEAASVLPEAIRLVELRARIPRYQREMLRWLAKRDATTVDAVLSRELEDVASAHSEELAAGVPGFGTALAWPG